MLNVYDASVCVAIIFDHLPSYVLNIYAFFYFLTFVFCIYLVANDENQNNVVLNSESDDSKQFYTRVCPFFQAFVG